MLLSATLNIALSQDIINGNVYDASTNQPVENVTVHTKKDNNIVTDKNGFFSFNNSSHEDSVFISSIGYQSLYVPVKNDMTILLIPSFTNLNEVIVSGSRELQKRIEVPVAINIISKTLINDTKATRLDMLINKIPGAFMTDLGNEQHSMSLRQPLGYNSLYLYMEDGIPIRTTGDFNHNALIEINQASLGRIEVIKGPASSLYGSEAVGGAINFITQSPSKFFTAKLQAEAGSMGYRRTDFNISNTIKKFGFYIGGYYVNQNQPANEHNDFYKGAITLRGDYEFNDKTKLITTADIIRYKTDQKGGLDSAHFYNKDYTSSYRFTYRKVNAIRIKSTLSKEWNNNNKTNFTVFYTNSAIGQNPFYYIGDMPGNNSKANGQVNEDAFNSYGMVIQHDKKFKKGKWITGISGSFSPATYFAKYIDIDKNNSGIYYQYNMQDSLLTNYKVDLLNTALYTQFQYNLTDKLRLTASIRYDRLDYKFDNYLLPAAFTGAPDTKNHFDHFTPKVGFTYDFGNKGIYVNYSVGFAPPNITDLYTGVKVPFLQPSVYKNYELGTWMSFASNKASAEVSLYRLDGTNEIVNVRLPDGTYQNQNAGITQHQGIETNIKYAPCDGVTIRLGGTVARHIYKTYLLRGKDFSGNEMPQAPAYIINSEITYKPKFFNGFRMSLEYEGLGKYYTDAENTSTYNGFTVFNARIGYAIHHFEIWANCINLTNKIYATTVEKSDYGTSYRPGQLRTLNIGLAYNFKKKSR
jgi:outer membrane receptor protein involved in Fe transport